MSLVWVTKANYLKEYQIEIEFNNSKKGVVDLKRHLDKKYLNLLKKLIISENLNLILGLWSGKMVLISLLSFFWRI
jgi:hypothetical protein